MSDPLRANYRPLTEPEKFAIAAVKGAGEEFLKVLHKYSQPGREDSLARTRIEEAVMWAVKGITAPCA